MKQTLLSALIASIIVFAGLAFMGQGRDDWRYGGRINGKMSVRDSATVEGILTIRSRLIGSSANFATIDSFTTTAAADTITMTGAEVGDVLLVSQLTPTWSATPDTNVTYHAYVISSNTVGVLRTKDTPAADLKSAGIYCIVRIEK